MRQFFYHVTQIIASVPNAARASTPAAAAAKAVDAIAVTILCSPLKMSYIIVVWRIFENVASKAKFFIYFLFYPDPRGG